MTPKTTVSQQIISALAENTAQLAEIRLSMQVLSDSVTRVNGLANEIQRTLRGSNGSSGLIGRVEAVERSESDCDVERLSKIIDGNEKEPGILERIRKYDEFQASLKKWFYLIASAIMVDFVLRIWPEITNLLNKP